MKTNRTVVALSGNYAYRFTLMRNGHGISCDCPICGQNFKPDVGYWITLDGNDGLPVCLDCIEKYDSALHAALDAALKHMDAALSRATP